MRKMSISAKISLMSCGILLVFLLIGGSILVLYEKELISSFIDDNLTDIKKSINEREKTERESLSRNVRFNTDTLSQACAGYLWQFVTHGLRQTLRSYMEYPEIIAIKVVNEYEEPVMAAWKNPNLNISERLPHPYSQTLDPKNMFRAESFLNEEKVGVVYVYYTEKVLAEKIKGIKELAFSNADTNHSKLLTRLSRTSLIQVFVIITLLIFMVVCLIILLKVMIFRPIRNVSNIARRLAEYDLTIEINMPRDDEIGQLILAAKNMVESLKEIISLASGTAVQVSSAAGEISSSAIRQAAVTAQQSASISEISSTMERLSSASEEIADHTNSVAEIAESTFRRSHDGAESVNRVMQKIKEVSGNNRKNIRQIFALGEKAEEINKVMDIINNVADQTRLIAFNAALEASSAGEAGKRFGVVAAEIRRLADNVTSSTGEIESKITEIQEAANRMVMASEKGSKDIDNVQGLFSQTSQVLSDIVSKAQSTTDAASRISMSTRQQKNATEQIAATLKDIVLGSEQTSEAINSISTISEEMAALSDDLHQLMQRFTLKKTDESKPQSDQKLPDAKQDKEAVHIEDEGDLSEQYSSPDFFDEDFDEDKYNIDRFPDLEKDDDNY